MRSLQGKIIFVYLALVVLTMGLALMALLEVNLIANKVRSGSRISEFFDATLELRRFEKNHFLYGKPADLAENTRYTLRAIDLLAREREVFAAVLGNEPVNRLSIDLRRYRQLMEASAWQPQNETLTAEVRVLGHHIVTAGETLASRERASLNAALSAHQRNFLIWVSVVVALLALAGVLLVRWVTRPLKAMEARMGAVAQGHLARLDLDVRERELASLAEAFNHVLDELERRQGTLVRAEKLASLGTLLSGVAHELNNPLSNISSSAQILVAEPDCAAEFRGQLLIDIDAETRRAASIVRSLLDYARDSHFRRQALNLSDLVDETLRFLKNLHPAGIELRVEVPAHLTLQGDRARLQQVLINLIRNAFEAMGDYGELSIVASQGTKRLAGGPAETVIDLIVCDRGTGIPVEVLPRIFDPFYTTKPVGHGNGLGLFIVHEIVAEHGGTISAENSPEGGACFHLRLPIIGADAYLSEKS